MNIRVHALNALYNVCNLYIVQCIMCTLCNVYCALKLPGMTYEHPDASLNALYNVYNLYDCTMCAHKMCKMCNVRLSFEGRHMNIRVQCRMHTVQFTLCKCATCSLHFAVCILQFAYCS